MRWQSCPVCNGFKTVSRPPWIAGDQQTWSTSNVESYPCPTCKATGLVLAPADGIPSPPRHDVTVQELVAALAKMPPDAEVVYWYDGSERGSIQAVFREPINLTPHDAGRDVVLSYQDWSEPPLHPEDQK